MLKSQIRRRWRNWSGLVQCEPNFRSYPVAVHPAHRSHAVTPLVRYNEIEYCVPVARVPEVLLQVDRLVRALKLHAHLPLQVRYQRADTLWLSPAYNRDSACIAAQAYAHAPHEDWFAALADIFDRNDGRPQWARLHDRSAHQLRQLFPRFADFLELRRELDPRGVFLNPHLAGMFGVEDR
ncbi:MAG TPA: D-arabinono-1,4-lactone oxidase [Solimonas sp.]|nr:D-arabinono-1,4-lactone oxidase [Solimonas sp.]